MIRHLKTAEAQASNFQDEALTKTVQALLDEVDKGGDAAVRKLAIRFDGMDRESYRLTKTEIEACLNSISKQEREDIEFAQEQVRNFAEAQKAALTDIEVETLPGVILGHRNVPVQSVGCYVPGGKYPLLASAHMSVDLKVAGCDRVSLRPPSRASQHRAIVRLNTAGAEEIYVLGGVQAVAVWHWHRDHPACRYAGWPSNAYVAEAKRLLFGRVGIDLFAGPTEVLILADDTVDGELVATDLLGQAEHGTNSPAILVTNSEKLAKNTVAEIERLLRIMPTAEIAGTAWRNHGEIILCETREEMLAEADRIASEHVQVMTADDDWFLDKMRNYGALFLGARTTVAYGDKVMAPTILTHHARRAILGLWVGKFIKTCTYNDPDRSGIRDGR